jgi:hypothetical protein
VGSAGRPVTVSTGRLMSTVTTIVYSFMGVVRGFLSMIIEELKDGDEGATTTARDRQVESEGVNSTEA